MQKPKARREVGPSCPSALRASQALISLVALRLHSSVPWLSKRSCPKGLKTHNPAAGSGALGCAGRLANQRVGTGQGHPRAFSKQELWLEPEVQGPMRLSRLAFQVKFSSLPLLLAQGVGQAASYSIATVTGRGRLVVSQDRDQLELSGCGFGFSPFCSSLLQTGAVCLVLQDC